MTETVPATDLGQQVETLITSVYPSWVRPLIHKPKLSAFVVLLIITSGQILLSIGFGVFSDNPDRVDLIEDSGYVWVQIASAFILYYYLRLPTLLGSAFSDLATNKVFREQFVKVDPQIKRLLDSVVLRSLTWGLMILIGVVFVGWSLLNPDDVVFWSDYPPVLLGSCVLWSIVWYTGSALLVNAIMGVRISSSIVRTNKIVVYKLHPDRSGGFSPLSRFSLHVTYFAVVYGVNLLFWGARSLYHGTVAEDYMLMLNVLIYTLVVPILFYMPLYQVHREMREFRDDLVRDTSARFLAIQQRAHQINDELDAEQLETTLRELAALKALEKIDRTTPVWPFSFQIQLRVWFNTLAPIIPTVLGLALEVVL